MGGFRQEAVTADLHLVAMVLQENTSFGTYIEKAPRKRGANDLNGLHGLEPGLIGRGVNAGILQAGFGPVQPTHP